MVLIPNNSALGSSAGAAISGELEPKYASMRALRSGRARLKVRAGDALGFLLSGHTDCVVWAGEPLTWQRVAVTAMLNISSLLAVATFGLLIWAFRWWAFLGIPGLAMFYVLWARRGHLVRTAIVFVVIAAGVGGIKFGSHIGPQLVWLFGVVVSCLGIQATHYLAQHLIISLAMTNETALDGLERKGIARVVPVGATQAEGGA